MKYLFTLLLAAMVGTVFAQGVKISPAVGNPDPSAGLEVDFSDRGFLAPRMTEADRLAISNPANSLLVYQTDATPGYYFNFGTATTPEWKLLATTDALSGGCGTSNLDFTIATNINTVDVLTNEVNEDVEITLAYVSGDVNPITFEVTGLPAGVSYDLITDGSGFPSLTTLQLYVSGSAVAGTYPITITANCGASPQSTSVSITVLQTKRVFVTSTKHDGNMGGIAGADAICQSTADGESLGGTWKAWLATDNTDEPVDRFVQNPGPYVMLDGTIIANDFADLNGYNTARIQVDETGFSSSNTYGFSAYAWNNINQGIVMQTNAVYTCDGYTSNSSSQYSQAGQYCRLYGSTYRRCDNSWHLVCVEQ